MFDYERAAGQAYMKDNRLKSYAWTDTGIKLTILDIKKEMDLGKYEGDVDIGSVYEQTAIEIKEIFGKSFILLDKYYNCKNYHICFSLFVCPNSENIM